jgi:hypothetical protein
VDLVHVLASKVSKRHPQCWRKKTDCWCGARIPQLNNLIASDAPLHDFISINKNEETEPTKGVITRPTRLLASSMGVEAAVFFERAQHRSRMRLSFDTGQNEYRIHEIHVVVRGTFSELEAIISMRLGSRPDTSGLAPRTDKAQIPNGDT